MILIRMAFWRQGNPIGLINLYVGFYAVPLFTIDMHLFEYLFAKCIQHITKWSSSSTKKRRSISLKKHNLQKPLEKFVFVLKPIRLHCT